MIITYSDILIDQVRPEKEYMIYEIGCNSKPKLKGMCLSKFIINDTWKKICNKVKKL